MRLIPVIVLASSTLFAQNAFAQSRIFCCENGKGVKVCGDFLPDVCQGRAYEERDSRGFIAKQVEAPLTPEQQAQRAAEKARKEAEEKKAAEDRRRNLALLATYSSEKNILDARDKALAEIEKNRKQSELRLEEAKKKRKKIEQDKEFYKGKPLPEDVKARFAESDKEIAAQTAAVAGKVKEAEETKAKFEEERKRFLELTGKKGGAEAAAAPAPAKPERAIDKR